MKYLIVGLGNIGDEYANTRHNIGFIVADALILDTPAQFTTERYASVAQFGLKGKKITVIKPSTYMNLSGKAVNYWMHKENIPLENLLVIVDDLALPVGALRLKSKGSDGGHNGLISLIENLNTIDFARLRVGIGNDFAKGFQAEYVLGKWTKQEEFILKDRIPLAVEQIKCFILQGVERAMNGYNRK